MHSRLCLSEKRYTYGEIVGKRRHQYDKSKSTSHYDKYKQIFRWNAAGIQ